MKSLLYYNANMVTHLRNFHLPGIQTFSKFFTIYNPSVLPIDRTGTITFPIRTHSLFPIPHVRPFSKTFAEVCDERATELIAHSETSGAPIKVLWSGGIDSTLVLVSLLKRMNEAQKKRMTVLLSDHSVAENPNFYREHIHGKLSVDSSILFPYSLGDSSIVIGGEHNDQLFGSDAVGKFITQYGSAFIHAPYDRNTFKNFFAKKLNDESMAEFYTVLFEKLCAAAPVPLDTNFLRLWWVNFSTKWQSVFMRSIAFTAPANQPLISRSYLEERYIHFYNTEAFQLWSLNNPDKRIKDTWASYKWPCKDIIYDFTKDAEYRDHKTKKASLYHIFTQLPQSNFIDTDLKFHEHLPAQEYIVSSNDFI